MQCRGEAGRGRALEKAVRAREVAWTGSSLTSVQCRGGAGGGAAYKILDCGTTNQCPIGGGFGHSRGLDPGGLLGGSPTTTNTSINFYADYSIDNRSGLESLLAMVMVTPAHGLFIKGLLGGVRIPIPSLWCSGASDGPRTSADMRIEVPAVGVGDGFTNNFSLR